MKNEEISLATKKAMASALQEAMKKKDFTKITVKEIIEACNINRNTFYYHFADIYELLHWMFREEALGQLEQYDLISEQKEALTFVLSYIQQKESILRCVCNSIGHEELKRYFQDDFMEIVDTMIREGQKTLHTELEETDRQCLCLFLTEAIAGMLVRYINTTDTELRERSMEAIPDLLRITITGFLAERGKPVDRAGM